MKTTMFNGWAAHLKTVSAPTFQTKLWLGPFNIGKEQIVPHILLSEEECEALLHSKEKTTKVDRPGHPVVRWDTNVLPANKVCEDRHSIDLISGDGLPRLLPGHDEGKSFWEKWFGVRTSILPHQRKRASQLMQRRVMGQRIWSCFPSLMCIMGRPPVICSARCFTLV
jgi:hypothetical protein